MTQSYLGFSIAMGVPLNHCMFHLKKKNQTSWGYPHDLGNLHFNDSSLLTSINPLNKTHKSPLNNPPYQPRGGVAT